MKKRDKLKKQWKKFQNIRHNNLPKEFKFQTLKMDTAKKFIRRNKIKI
jgi:hypothetical protein